MRSWIVLGLFGLAVWAQTGEAEPRSAVYYSNVRQVLVLTGEEPAPGDRVEVVDLIGRRVAVLPVSAALPAEVSLPALPEGLYYARWISEGGRLRAVRRFSVQR